MSTHEAPNQETVAKRAQFEQFRFAVAAPRKVNVENQSYGSESTDHTYTVTVDGRATACTCPDHKYRERRCKHMTAVDEKVSVDHNGGAYNCKCVDGDDLPCWPCYRRGVKEFDD